MPSTKPLVALALILAAGLPACAGGSGTYSTPERSGTTYGSSAYIYEDDRGPQARNGNAYMRQ